MTHLLPFVGRPARHRWTYRGITNDGHFRLQCRCGAVSLRPAYQSPYGEVGASGEHPTP